MRDHVVVSNCMGLLETTMEACVGVKTGRSRVGGPKLCVMDRWVTGDKGHCVYPGSGPLNGGNTLLPA